MAKRRKVGITALRQKAKAVSRALKSLNTALRSKKARKCKRRCKRRKSRKSRR